MAGRKVVFFRAYVKSFEMVCTNKLRHDDDCWTTEDVGNGSRNSYDEGYDVSEEEQIGH